MELYINDILVDLEQGVPFPLNYQISDIRSPESRKGNSSKTIKLPGTRRNCEILSTVYALTTTSTDDIDVEAELSNFDPSVKATARYYQNGLLQFQGMAQLTECSKMDGVWSFSMVLFSDNLDIFTLLKNYKLRELGWSEYDHDLTYTNISNSWSGSIIKNAVAYNNYSGTDWLGEGYYYGLIDYGYDRPADDQFEVTQIPLQVYVKSIVDKMFDKIDVNYTSSFFDTQQFKRLLLAYEGGVFPDIDSATATSYSIETDQKNNASGFIVDKTLDCNQVAVPGSPFQTFVPVGIASVIGYNSDDATDVDPSSQIQSHIPMQVAIANEGEYTLTYQGDHDVNFDFTLTGGSGSPSVYANIKAYLSIFKNGTLYQEDEIWNNVIDTSTLTNSFTASFSSTFSLSLDPSDILEFKIRIYSPNASVIDSTATSATLDFDVTATTCQLDLAYNTNQVVPGGAVTLTQFLPDMDCATFMKGLINMFNLIVKPDQDAPRELVIEPLDDFYNDATNAEDWTYLVDRSREWKVTPTVNFAKKEYIYKFTNDPDYWNTRYFTDVTEQYGSKTIVSPSQFATGEMKVELPFANKLLGEIPNTDLIVPRNFQVKTAENGTSEIVERRGKAFIVQIKKGNVGTMQTANWGVIDEAGTYQAETEYPYVGHLDDIDTPTFDLMYSVPSYVFYDIPAGISYTTNNLYGYHEKSLREVVDKNGKMLSCYVNLNADTINRLDFANLIRIDNVVYRLQKVENYDPTNNEPTRCELIRLIEGDNIQTYTINSVSDDTYLPPTEKKARVTETNVVRDLEDASDTRRIH